MLLKRFAAFCAEVEVEVPCGLICTSRTYDGAHIQLSAVRQTVKGICFHYVDRCSDSREFLRGRAEAFYATRTFTSKFPLYIPSSLRHFLYIYILQLFPKIEGGWVLFAPSGGRRQYALKNCNAVPMQTNVVQAK